MPLSRRDLLTRTAATGLGLALVGSVDTLFGADAASAATSAVPGPYGPLVNDPAGVLALPKGFRYSIVARAGVTRLETGELTPARADGTTSFARPAGGHVLVQNHEIGDSSDHPVPHLAGYVYDEGAFGGTTTIEVTRAGERIRERVSLAGTADNCAGGRTPWGTWLSCEETEARVGDDGYTKDHGYVFEVDPLDNAANQSPQPVKALGRFPHEAVVVDPKTGRLYLTEDANTPNGLLYRFTPPASALPLKKGSLKALGPTAGTFEAMIARSGGTVVPDLSVAKTIGTTYDVAWKAVPDRDARTVSTRKQFTYEGQLAGEGAGGVITRSRKLEGMWWGDGGTYFVSSYARFEDGSAARHDGQVWFLDPVASTIMLVLRFAFTPGDADRDPDGPDNITVSPFGGVIIAEDGSGKQHLLGSTPDGRTFQFARNDLESSEEMTGPNFSYDKTILFANIQEPGTTFAITGPFRRQT